MMSKFLKRYWLFVSFFLLIVTSSFKQNLGKQSKTALITIVFINTVKHHRIILNDSLYTNPFGEKYSISKLRYYVTDIELQQNNTFFKEKDSYHLIDESDSSSRVIKLKVPAGDYQGLKFLLGVDSLHNVSGAQSGDLDPAKDMFWTWNSGYVMAKMEGNSAASTLVNHKFEFHIGGFSGPFNVLKKIDLKLPDNALKPNAGNSYTIVIDADVNTWWQGTNDIKIAEHAAITSPGINAKNISDNYAKMFHIEKIILE